MDIDSIGDFPNNEYLNIDFAMPRSYEERRPWSSHSSKRVQSPIYQRARWTYQPSAYRCHTMADHAFDLLAQMQTSGQLCDVTLIAGESPDDQTEADTQMTNLEAEDDQSCSQAATRVVGISAHKVILSAASDYFRAMFTGTMQEASQNTVYIHGVTDEALRSLVRFIYTHEIDIGDNNVQALLPAAALLQLTDVHRECSEYLKMQLHPTNCLGIRDFADLHSCNELHKAAKTFVEHHFAELQQCEEFLALTSSQVKELISNDGLTVGEEHVFEAAMSWVRHDIDNRRQHLPQLMEHVRLPLLSRDYLLHKVDSEPLIRDSVPCKDYLIEALKFHLLKMSDQATSSSTFTIISERVDSPLAFGSRVKPRQPSNAPKFMLIIGGQAPKAIRNVDAFDFEHQRWLPMAELPNRRCRCGIAVAEPSPSSSQVYAIGGFNGSMRIRTVDVLDMQRDQWYPGQSMESRRSTLGVTYLNGRIFAIGGFDGSVGLYTCEAYDSRCGEWHAIGNMSSRRSSVGVGVLDGYVYAIGGYDGQCRNCLSSAEQYEPRMDRWMPIADMATRRSGCGVCVVDGMLFAIGGHDGPIVKRSVEAYDPKENGWRQFADMNIFRRNAGVVSLNSTIYAVGGDDGTSNLQSVETYNRQQNVWTRMPFDMAIARSYAGIGVVNKLN